MSTFTKRRLVAAAVGLVVAAPLAVGAVGSISSAAPARTAATAVDTTYLTETFPGLPATNILETVTYDRFQWLLQQSGQFAFVIGSTADAGFKAKVVAAEAAAKAAGAAKVYWYDPNLSGQPGTKNLDTRNPDGINLTPVSRTIFENTWNNVLGQYLGNGIKSVPNATATAVTISDDNSVINDVDNPIWDYRSDAAHAPVPDSADIFFVYDKDNKVGVDFDKVRSWVNLSTTTVETVASATTTALTAAGGAASLDQKSQFQWWKDSANKKHDLSYSDDARYGGDILGDADDAAGFRVKQITYPELLHLLDIKDDANKNFVILFGGTWCHNTRAVIKHVNQEAQENNVTTVYNFDLVLDGGTVNGTNASGNPIHVRDNATITASNDALATQFGVARGTLVRNARPSYLYGDVVRSNFKNLVTEYDPNSGTKVAYYPGGDSTADLDVVRKLQVPFLINYQRGTGGTPAGDAVKRQWIQQNLGANGLPTFKEYMTEWWYTNPSKQLGLAQTPAPTQDQLDQAQAQVAFAQEGLAKLDDYFGGLPGAVVSTQTVTAPTVSYGTAPAVTLAIANKFGRIPAGTATLTVAGASYPKAVAQNAAAFTTATLAPGSYPFTISYAGDDQLVGFSTTGTLTVTKAKAPTAGSVVKAPTTKKAGKYKVAVTTPAGLAKATGKVTFTFTKGKTKKRVVGTVTAGVSTVKVPKLKKGTWKVATVYTGDANYLGATAAGKSVVVKK